MKKTVKIDDVAWIDPTQGMYANVKEKYSLSSERTTKKYGNVYGEDILLEKDEDLGPVREDVVPVKQPETRTEDIGPVREDTATKTEVDERFPMLDENDFAPISEEDALRNADEEQTNSLTDEDMPPEAEDVFYLSDTTSIDKKSLKNISAMGKDILFLNMKERRALEDVVQKYRLFS